MSRPLRTAAANYAVEQMNQLTHAKAEWAGQPFNLRPWQENGIIRPLFGALKNGIRQYRTCYVEIPRKNGKTELAAAIALYMLLCDGEKGAEVYSAAVDLEQASLAFNVAAQMVRNDSELSAGLEVIPSRKRIVHHKTGSFYRAIPADAPSAHGYNASCVICDELHGWPNRDLYDVLTTSMGARRQPLTFIITTAGFDRKSICWELHDYATKVRDGMIKNETFLPILYGAPDDADWLDESVWKASNPALGDFRSIEDMRIMAREAQEIPARQNTFRRLYLCQWTESETRWLDMTAWDACGQPVDPEALRGRTCYGGLDLSTTTDLSALTLAFPDDAGGCDLMAYFWAPAEGITKRSHKDRVPYDEWARRGFLQATTGNAIDYDHILATIGDLSARYRIAEIAYDPWNATDLVLRLQQEGAEMVPVRQTVAAMSAPSKELERLVIERKIRHGGHPILRWCAANAVIESDSGGNIKPSKRKSTERIDGVIATVLAIDRMTRGDGGSIYDERYARGESVLTVV